MNLYFRCYQNIEIYWCSCPPPPSFFFLVVILCGEIILHATQFLVPCAFLITKPVIVGLLEISSEKNKTTISLVTHFIVLNYSTSCIQKVTSFSQPILTHNTILFSIKMIMTLATWKHSCFLVAVRLDV